MKRRVIPWVTALFFITILSCDRGPDPECKDASCCRPEINQFVEYIHDVPAHLSGPPQFTNWAFRISKEYPSDPQNPYKSRNISICENTMEKIRGFKAEFEGPDSTLSYDYLISGKILADVKSPRSAPSPLLSIYIDKIVKIK